MESKGCKEFVVTHGISRSDLFNEFGRPIHPKDIRSLDFKLEALFTDGRTATLRLRPEEIDAGEQTVVLRGFVVSEDDGPNQFGYIYFDATASSAATGIISPNC